MLFQRAHVAQRVTRSLTLAILLVIIATLPAAARAAAPDTTVNGSWVTRFTKVTYSFGANQAGAVFDCSLNWGTWSRCSSPTSVTAQSGTNNLRVRAMNPGGEVDASPAIRWTYVDLVTPTVSVQGLDSGAVVQQSTPVTVGGKDDFVLGKLDVWIDDTAKAARDLGNSSTVGSLSVALDPTKLSPGRHALRATATDRAGNAKEMTVAFWVRGKPLFSADSVWRKPLTSDAPLDHRNAAITAAFVKEINRQITAGVGPWINTTAYTTPLYWAARDAPRVPVTLDGMDRANPLAAQFAAGVPIPPHAAPAVGSDAHLTVYQPETDLLWEMWGAVKRSDGWHARFGGVLHEVSKSPGHFRDMVDAKGTALERKWWGATGSSLPAIAGTVTMQDVQEGRVDHAIAIAVPSACARTFAWPAQRTDGVSTAQDCIPEGARLRLNPALDLSKRSMPRFTRMLAEAAQRYGIIVVDQTSSVTTFTAEDTSQYGRNLWWGTNGRNGLLGGEPWNLVQGAFPWEELQLLQMTLGS